ncbi:MAG: hypothetical protein ACRDSF_21140 [Pseudonocardiaceae bacterium]
MVLAVAAVVWFGLLRHYGGQQAQIQLDATRTRRDLSTAWERSSTVPEVRRG